MAFRNLTAKSAKRRKGREKEKLLTAEEIEGRRGQKRRTLQILQSVSNPSEIRAHPLNPPNQRSINPAICVQIL